MNSKIIFVGNSRTHKTLVAKELLNNRISRYYPTLGVEVHVIQVGDKRYNLWDCAGDERYGGMRDGYYIGAKIAFVFSGWEEEQNKLESRNKSVAEYIIDILRVEPHCVIHQIENVTSQKIKDCL